MGNKLEERPGYEFYKVGSRLYEDENYAEAIPYLEKAVEAGNVDAMCNLGHAYNLGNGVPLDITKAIECYTMASDLGYTTADINLGYLYESGKYVPRDRNKAIYYYKHAAKNGDAYGARLVRELSVDDDYEI